MQSPLQVRLLSGDDAAAYQLLRARSLEELAHPVEPQVFRELEAGAGGMSSLLASYMAEDVQVWGAFDGETLAGAVGLSRRSFSGYGNIGLLWGVFVLLRYRGTPTSRLLMDAVTEYCTADTGIRQLRASCTRDNLAGQQFLKRFGFEVISGGAVPGVTMRRLI
ncbi:GNAT family N-acetyltransferase [Luteimonas saliphila]|uniref:GNAT family N-acetyltransferase n=1 Tax=Luteimonas saliphila TaxID=2804919 RepID=UPI00192E119D|nr:GNAT family N-acetyltransferase [Luteimonas saliphila]